MIFGRPKDLVATAATALLNVLFLVAGQLGYVIDPAVIAAVNLAAGALIAVLAYQAPTVKEGATVNVQTPEGEPNRTVTV